MIIHKSRIYADKSRIISSRTDTVKTEIQKQFDKLHLRRVKPEIKVTEIFNGYEIIISMDSPLKWKYTISYGIDTNDYETYLQQDNISWSEMPSVTDKQLEQMKDVLTLLKFIQNTDWGKFLEKYIRKI